MNAIDLILMRKDKFLRKWDRAHWLLGACAILTAILSPSTFPAMRARYGQTCVSPQTLTPCLSEQCLTLPKCHPLPKHQGENGSLMGVIKSQSRKKFHQGGGGICPFPLTSVNFLTSLKQCFLELKTHLEAKISDFCPFPHPQDILVFYSSRVIQRNFSL